MPANQKPIAFKVFPQNPFAFRAFAASQPSEFLADLEVTPCGTLWSGHADGDDTIRGFGDDHIYVANYCQKAAYETSIPSPHVDTPERPPSGGLMGPLPKIVNGSVAPLDPGGWDQLSNRIVEGSVCAPAFAVAMVYAIARQTIDLWQGYIGKPIVWYCAQRGRKQRRSRLEIVPMVATCGAETKHKNAVSGYGYIELGIAEPDDRDLFPVNHPRRINAPGLPPPRMVPYWLNADTVAHEVGHQILYATLGFGARPPKSDWLKLGGPKKGQAFRAFHESFGDIVAIMTAVQSDMVLDHVLRQTEGFLFQDTALTDIGEITSAHTIRDVHDHDDEAAPAPDRSDPKVNAIVKEYYALSEALTGTFFDVLISIAARCLDGLDEKLVVAFEDQVRAEHRYPSTRAPLEKAVRALYRTHGPGPFRIALRQASAALGGILGEFLNKAGRVEPASFTIDELRAGLVRAGRQQMKANPASPLSRVGRERLAAHIERRLAGLRPAAR